MDVRAAPDALGVHRANEGSGGRAATDADEIVSFYF